MSDTTSERLYGLLPSIYRLRDADVGEPLRALLAIVEGELEALEADTDRVYDNWFVETCDEWVVPYIGDLLDVPLLHTVGDAVSHRAYVANALAHRRRKGTVTALEQVARDVTGWPARVTELFEHLATTQHLGHVRPGRGATLDLREADRLELVGGPFEHAAHGADVRGAGRGGGRYNIANVGVFLWRLRPYAVRRGSARSVGATPDGRFRFNSLGLDAPLFNRPETETEIGQRAQERNVPGPLRRRPLHEELEARRQAIANGRTPDAAYFGVPPVLEVFVDGQAEPIPSEQMLICDLSDPPTLIATGWRRPPTTRTYTRADGASVAMPIRVAVDPVLGRLAFPVGTVPAVVEVSYVSGFSADLGGGPYDRRDSVAVWLDRPVTFQVGVSRHEAPSPGRVVATLREALDAWKAHAASQRDAFGVIAIMDSASYQEELTGQQVVDVPAGARLAIVAADWPAVELADQSGRRERQIGQASPTAIRPHLRGNLSARGTAPDTSDDPGELILDGLLIEGTVSVLAGNLGRLRVAHCTLAPPAGAIKAHARNTRLRVELDHSICGSIALPDGIPRLQVVDSIVGHDGAAEISAPGAAAVLERSTVFGGATLGSLEASSVIFTAPITVERQQVGSVRFSFVPTGSRTPRRERCQPDLSLAGPSFTTRRYGEPSFAQLSPSCPDEILEGAENGAEMGVFNRLRQPQRLANLHAGLEEHLRFGLEANISYAT